MARIWTLFLFLGLQPSLWADELSELLDRMEKSREGLKNLKAQITTWHKEHSKEKEETRFTSGRIWFRFPAEFAWCMFDVRNGEYHHPEDKSGTRAILNENEFLLRSPWGSKEFPQTNHLGRESHGAEWFRGAPGGETPPLLPLLADRAAYFPIPWVLDLAPKRFLSKLPRLKLGAVKKEGDRSFQMLLFRPEGDDFKVRQAEADRSYDNTSFLHGEVWVDTSDLRIARLRLRFIGCDRRYSVLKREKGLPTTILTEVERDGGSPWSQRLELTDVSINSGVDDEEVRLSVPAGRLVRDWTTRPEAHYLDRLKRDPKDAEAWLEIAGLNMKLGEWASAEEAFRKVTSLRPDAPEGYLGLLGALHMNSDKGAGAEVLENAAALSWPFFHRAAAERYFARGDRDSGRRHLESILAILGEDVATLEELGTVSGDSAEAKALYMRALRADLDQGSGFSAHSLLHYRLHPSNQEREDLVALHQEALKKASGRPWIHYSLMELCDQLGKKEESRKSAKNVLKLLEEGKPGLGLGNTLQLLKVFTTDKDFESAHRLRKALASHPRPDARAWGLVVEGELVAIQEDLDGVVRHLDTALAPEREDKSRWPNTALKPFLEALKREQKLEPLAARLLETPADSDRGRFHTNVLSYLAEQLAGSDRQKFLARAEERRNGRAADVTWSLNIVQSLAREKKWAEARAQAQALLARKDLSKDGRAIAESALAECHDAAGEYDSAVAACDRAMAESPPRAPWVRMIRGRALLAAKDIRKAVDNFAIAFEERMTPLEDMENWSPEKMLLEDLRRNLAAHKELLGEIETAAGADRGRVGFMVVLSVVEELKGRPQGAAEALERACGTRVSSTLLRELLVSSLSAGRIDRAIEIRGKLAAVAHGKPPTGRINEPFDIDKLNEKILRVCEEKGDIDLCKRYTRALAGEPLGRFRQEWTIRDLLLLILEEEFIAEIDATLARNAKDEWQRFHAHFPAAWAYGEAGLGGRGAEIYERILKEQPWSESYRSMGASWIEQLKGKTVAFPVDRVLLWLERGSAWKDESIALADVATRYQGELNALDRTWRFLVHQGKAEAIHLKLGAVRSRNSQERVDCLEELIRRGEPRPEWTLMLAMTRVNRQEEDRAAPILLGLLKATPQANRGDLWSLFDEHLRGYERQGPPLAANARAWGRRFVADTRKEMAEDSDERLAAAMELAQVFAEQAAPLQAFLALAGAGEGQPPERLVQMRTALRALLPRDLFDALKRAELPKPRGQKAKDIEKLIKGLGSDDYDTRMTARRGLVRVGAPAIPDLLTLANSTDADLRSHAQDILRALMGE